MVKVGAAASWLTLTKDIHKLEPGEELLAQVGPRRVVIRLATEEDLIEHNQLPIKARRKTDDTR